MRKKDFKGRCVKKTLSKCKVVCKTYDNIQTAYADILQAESDIKEIKCNVLLDNFDMDGSYTTDFFIVKSSGDIAIRECVNRNHLVKPMTIKLLDFSKDYWSRRGVIDWGLIINEK